MESKKTIQKINESKILILEEINKIHKSLTRLVKKKKIRPKYVKSEMKEEK